MLNALILRGLKPVVVLQHVGLPAVLLAMNAPLLRGLKLDEESVGIRQALQYACTEYTAFEGIETSKPTDGIIALKAWILRGLKLFQVHVILKIERVTVH